MSIGLILLSWVFSRDEDIYLFQIQTQPKNYISKFNARPKTKACLKPNSYHSH